MVVPDHRENIVTAVTILGIYRYPCVFLIAGLLPPVGEILIGALAAIVHVADIWHHHHVSQFVGEHHREIEILISQGVAPSAIVLGCQTPHIHKVVDGESTRCLPVVEITLCVLHLCLSVGRQLAQAVNHHIVNRITHHGISLKCNVGSGFTRKHLRHLVIVIRESEQCFPTEILRLHGCSSKTDVNASVEDVCGVFHHRVKAHRRINERLSQSIAGGTVVEVETCPEAVAPHAEVETEVEGIYLLPAQFLILWILYREGGETGEHIESGSSNEIRRGALVDVSRQSVRSFHCQTIYRRQTEERLFRDVPHATYRPCWGVAVFA